MSDFFSMGGYGFYVWASVAVFVLVLMVDAVTPLMRRRRVLASLRARIKREGARGSRA